MTIRLTLKDEYRDYKDPNPIITDISNTPYNLTQTVQKLAYANSNDGTGDSEKFVVEVLNNPGVTLPATGGPGTTFIYILGTMLTGLAGTILALRRKRRAA
jgi:LPXTG-motif cell wall-anchored protein